MSIKDLFNKNKSPKNLPGTTVEEVGAEVESRKLLNAKIIEKNRFTPSIDFTSASNFARFGSAEKYYEDSIKRIYQTYPYDGSLYEKVAWQNSSSYLDNWIFDNEYPRTNGYIHFSKDGWGTRTLNTSALILDDTGSIGLPSTVEYIEIKGGPNTSTNYSTLKEQFSHQKDKGFKTFQAGKGTFFDTGSLQDSNLKFKPAQGMSVEFWLKKSDLVDRNLTTRECIFDLRNEKDRTLGGGRFSVYLANAGTTATSAPGASDPVLGVYCRSGSFTFNNTFTDATKDAIIDGNWHHHAITVKNDGDPVTGKLNVNYYLDGEYKQTIVSSSCALGEVTSSLMANVGAYRALDAGAGSTIGYGKLSGALDEFRYWKFERTSEQIGRYWRDQVGGGTNTDDANKYLGVYYKFNEGITGTSSVDNTVLDYSGRLANGSWTGYSSGARSTNSAIVEASASSFEFKDPILYYQHQSVDDLMTAKKSLGKEHDYTNPALIYNSIPSWVREEDENNSSNILNLTQIISSYFDTLHVQIQSLSELKSTVYLSSSYKALPFAAQLIESKGVTTSEIFVDAEVLEYVSSRGEDKLFSEDITEIKNLIYHNIYNNLSYILKSKGTEKAIRNLLHCYGVGEDLIKLNMYSSDAVYTFEDNYETTTIDKKYINFASSSLSSATVFQFTGSSDSANSVSYISGSLSASSFTTTIEIIFPKEFGQNSLYFWDKSHTTSSLFGMHTARGNSAQQQHDTLQWASPDYANFQVYATRDSVNSSRIRFHITSSSPNGFIPYLRSNYFEESYDVKKWNLAVKMKPTTGSFAEGDPGFEHELYDLIQGSSGSERPYTLEFQGYNAEGDAIQNSFSVSASISQAYAQNFLKSNKRIYVGAHRTNFTGSVLDYTDVRISSVRHWLDYIPDDVLRHHALDPENFGTRHPYRQTYLFKNFDDQNKDISAFDNLHLPQAETLVLHWDFNNVTSSNAIGHFEVSDISSGSSDVTYKRYGHLGDIRYKRHTGRGFAFPNNTSACIVKEYVFSAKKVLPERLQSSNLIEIKRQNDEVFTKEARPLNYNFSFEKSAYRSVSQEMLKMFSSIVDFNNLIGEPVNKYRHEYKDLRKLKQLFFERVENTPSVDKYIKYYKWLDSSINEFIRQLIPATAEVSDIRNVIESHVLERNKYKHQYPTLEMKTPDPEGQIRGVNELLYPWKQGHAPIAPAGTNATATDALVVSSAGYEEAFTVNVPSAPDGTGTTVTVIMKNGDGGLGTPGANEIFFNGHGSGNDPRDRLILAINGTADSAVAKYGNGSDTLTDANVVGVGIKGLTAAVGTAVNPITLTATTPGLAGNDIEVIQTVGSNIVDTDQLTSGKLTGGARYNSADESTSCLWWKERTERTDTTSPLNVAAKQGINSDKEQIRRILTTSTVSGSTYAVRNFTKSYKFKTVKTKVIHGGVNFSENKKLNYIDNVLTQKRFPDQVVATNYVYVTSSLFAPDYLTASLAGCTDDDVYLGATPTNSYTPLSKMKLEITAIDSDASAVAGTNKIKADMVLPFNIYSSSIGHFQQYQSNIYVLGTGSIGREIRNLHHDSYSPTNEIPMQGPFTEKYVGGNQHRHIELNISASTGGDSGENALSYPAFPKRGLDQADTRPERFKIYVEATTPEGARALGTYWTLSPDIDEISFKTQKKYPVAIYMREEYAKRPVNIRNIRQLTSSDNHIRVTKIGNYDKNYHVVQTSGRITNNKWFRNTEGNINYSSVQILDMTHSLGGRSLSGLHARKITPGGMDYTLPVRTRNETIFVERFSAPGGPEVMSQGFLDAFSAEYSVYNCLNYRNLEVRRPLQALLVSSSGPQGTPINSVTASYHKVNRNTLWRPNLNLGLPAGGQFIGTPSRPADGVNLIMTASRDNWFVRHQIPRSDLQYSWITSSAYQITGGLGSRNEANQAVQVGYLHLSGARIPFEYERPNPVHASRASTDIVFVSSSDQATYTSTAGGGSHPHPRYFGYDYKHHGISDNTPLRIDFVGTNQVIYEPISSSHNLLGYPSLLTTNLDADTDVIINYVNRTMFGPTHVNEHAIDAPPGTANADKGIPLITNAILLHRNGPYQYPSWKQIRTGEHPVARYHRKNNIISIVEDPVTGKTANSFNDVNQVVPLRSNNYKHFVEPPVSAKYKPISHFLVIQSPNTEYMGTAVARPATPVELKHTYGNNLTTFSSQTGSVNYTLLETKEQATYVDALDFNSYSTNDDFKITVPTDANGAGTNIIIRITSANSTGRSVVGTAAVLTNAIDTTGISPGAVDAFTMTVPTSAGGDGVSHKFTMLADDAEVDALTGATDFGISAASTNGAVAATVAAAIIDAINGTVNAAVGYGGAAVSSVLAAGTLGLTAAEGSSDTQITLTMDAVNGGASGNVENVLAANVGFEGALLLESVFVGGLDAPGIMGVGVASSPTDETVAEAVVDAINNTSVFGHSIVDKGSGTSANGIAGLTAEIGTSSGKITLTATFAGSAGNKITIANITGDVARTGKLYGGTDTTPGFPRVIRDQVEAPIITLEAYLGSRKFDKQLYDDITYVLTKDPGGPGNPIQIAPNEKMLSYEETVWPREQNMFLGKTRGRTKHTQTRTEQSVGIYGEQRTFWRNLVSPHEGENWSETGRNQPGTWKPTLLKSGSATGDREINRRRIASSSLNSYGHKQGAAAFPGGIYTTANRVYSTGETIAYNDTKGANQGEWFLIQPPTLNVWPLSSPQSLLHEFTSSGDFWDDAGLATAISDGARYQNSAPPGTRSRVPGNSMYQPYQGHEFATSARNRIAGENHGASKFYREDIGELMFPSEPSVYASIQAGPVGNWSALSPLGVITHNALASAYVWQPLLHFANDGFPSDKNYTYIPNVPWYPEASGSSVIQGPATASQTYMFMGNPFWFAYDAESKFAAYKIHTKENVEYGGLDDALGVWSFDYYKTNEYSGKNPMYDTYDDFAADIRQMAKGHSVIPEFRISEHMDYYLNRATSAPNFEAMNNKFMTLEGAHISASAKSETSPEFDSEFMRLYSNSDFLKHFSMIKEDYEGTATPSRITLTCEGIKKLLPYQGFYPVLRTVQLGTMFSQSFGPGLSGSHLASTGSNMPHWMSALSQPFYSPGIMYNTIKAGIAMDYPVFTGSAYFDQTGLGTDGSAGDGLSIPFGYNRGLIRPDGSGANYNSAFTSYVNNAYNYRFPFEAIIQPELYLPISSSEASSKINLVWLTGFSGSAGASVVDGELGVKADRRPDVFAYWDPAKAKPKQNYGMAMNNFMAEVPNFFLQDGTFKTIVSRPQSDFKMMRSGSTYYMDIVLSKTPNFIMSEGPKNVGLVSRSIWKGVDGKPANSSDDGGMWHTFTNQTNFVDLSNRLMGGLSSRWYDNKNLNVVTMENYAGAIYGPATKVVKGGWELGGSTPYLGIPQNATVVARSTDDGVLDTTDAQGVPLPAHSSSATTYVYRSEKNIVDPAFAPHAPPYLYGDAIARIAFSPHKSRFMLSAAEEEFTLDEILGRCEIETDYKTSHKLLQAASDAGMPAGVSKMTVASSVNLFSKISHKSITYDQQGQVISVSDDTDNDENDVWVIQPKFECPILNFKDSLKGEKGNKNLYKVLGPGGGSSATNTGASVTEWSSLLWGNPISGSGAAPRGHTRHTMANMISGSLTRGMWGGYGKIPNSDEGVFISFRESFKDKIMNQAIDVNGITQPPNHHGSDNTGSLLQVCGFNKSMGNNTSLQLGQLAESKMLSEAIVAIPKYYDVSAQEWKFVPIDKNHFKNILYADVLGLEKEESSVSEMITLMQKYVIPPRFDFINKFKFAEVDLADVPQPFVMYIFEFSTELDKQDLADIWQGVMPKIAIKAEKDISTRSHPLAENEFFGTLGGIPDNLQWMVFKVKRKAAKSYWKKTADSSDDDRFTFEFNAGGQVIEGEPPYSYNWPYDFCSLVELAKIDTKIDFATIAPEGAGPPGDRSP